MKPLLCALAVGAVWRNDASGAVRLSMVGGKALYANGRILVGSVNGRGGREGESG